MYKRFFKNDSTWYEEYKAYFSNVCETCGTFYCVENKLKSLTILYVHLIIVNVIFWQTTTTYNNDNKSCKFFHFGFI